MNIKVKGSQELNKELTVVVENVGKHLKSSMTSFKPYVLIALEG